MQEYQNRYLKNAQEISAGQFEGYDELTALRHENSRLLEEYLFPVLDDLPSADAGVLQELSEFAAALMDRRFNLDCGLYILIHDALLSLYRIRKDRSGVIRELYALGMGHYYRNRMLNGLPDRMVSSFHFENEMIFTEGASYFKYFDTIGDDETKGYILRCLGNIAIATPDRKRRVAVSSRMLQIIQDDHYRRLAPSLPWDLYLRSTHQQMSSNRDVLSKGDLSSDELAAILESCHVVFEPEKAADDPNIRWLWPYYEMEYSLGLADLNMTLYRMRHLIESMPADHHDASGLYANVQLPIYYGRLLRGHPELKNRSEHVQFLADAYGKMIQCILSFPSGSIDDFFRYDLDLILYDYYETEGTPDFLSILNVLFSRIGGTVYARSVQTGQIMQTICRAIYDSDPSYFRHLPVFPEGTAPEETGDILADYAMQCGILQDIGLFGMHMDRLLYLREMFEDELPIYRLHTEAGHLILQEKPSTRLFADTALGHHSWYNGSGGWPDTYVRNGSNCRQMTDIAAIASFLEENRELDRDTLLSELFRYEGTRFSPLVTAYFGSNQMTDEVFAILSADPSAAPVS
ncbi:MAG: hypothetical protein IJ930_00645 [Lachnospiraceae bacterium]|nr:hypothetical protein [Lachnospiraceae bacterium]